MVGVVRHAGVDSGVGTGGALLRGEWKDGHELAFYVSSSGKATQYVSVGNGGLPLGCVGLAEKYEPLTITEVPLKEDGSFTAEGEQTGVIEGSEATFKYAFVGHLHTSESSGPARFAGVLRESVTFISGSKRECTTGEDSWSASYDTQGSTPASAPVGVTPAGNGTVAMR